MAMLLKSEQIFLMNSLSILWQVHQSVAAEPSAFQLLRFTTTIGTAFVMTSWFQLDSSDHMLMNYCLCSIIRIQA